MEVRQTTGSTTPNSQSCHSRSCHSRTCISVCHIFVRIITSHVGFIVILLVYMFVGAAVFMKIEGPHEQQKKKDIAEHGKRIIDDLWSLTIHPDRNETFFKAYFLHQLKGFEINLRNSFKHGIDSSIEKKLWDFWGSFFFCGTVITTIGYGHISPSTKIGRLCTILYAVVGIPLCFKVVADFGQLFANLLKLLHGTIMKLTARCRHGTKDIEDAGESERFVEPCQFRIPVSVALVIGVVYIVIGAFLYPLWETWTYLEAFYFIFISVSTIGFGDILPAHPRFFLLSSCYILIGLAVIAMVIKVISDYLESSFKNVQGKLTEMKKALQNSTYDLNTLGISKEGPSIELRNFNRFNSLNISTPHPHNVGV